MATVNISVPDEVKKAFNTTFQGQDKSAIIATLMREAVERAQRKQRAQEAAARILERCRSATVITAAEFRSARENGRP
jgi:metal-responsive CopG/Arc/MetJ family transcriptional regulator